MTVVWRLTLRQHTLPLPDGTPAGLLSGIGAATYPGRWNSHGIHVVYTSSSLALAAMEVYVNLGARVSVPNRVSIRVAIPDDIMAAAESVDPLPIDWNRVPAMSATRDIGTAWARAGRSALLRVPSVVVPPEFNYLINPLHPDTRRITATLDAEFAFDTRMVGAP